MNELERIGANVLDPPPQGRGYGVGLTAEQIAVRQVLKCFEEATEAVTTLGGLHEFDRRFLRVVRVWAAAHFDDAESYELAPTPDTFQEMADVQVTLATFATVTAQDVVALAERKSRAGISRGVR